METKIFWSLMPEADDHNSSIGIAQVLEVMERAGIDVKHLALLHGEIRKLGATIENICEYAVFQDISHVFGVHVP